MLNALSRLKTTFNLPNRKLGPKPDLDSVQATQKRKLPWNWLEALCIGLLALIGVDIVLGIGLSLLDAVLKANPATGWIPKLLNGSSIAVNFIFYGASRLVGLAVILNFIRRRGVGLRQFGLKGFKIGQALGLILISSGILLVVTIGIFVLIQQLFPSVDISQAQDIVFKNAASRPEIIMSFLALVVIAPVVEESIFRGLMLPVFSARFGIMAATLSTSALFGLIHWQLNVGIMTFCMGLLLAWLYYKTRSLWPAIMFHSLKNFVAFILLIHGS